MRRTLRTAFTLIALLVLYSAVRSYFSSVESSGADTPLRAKGSGPGTLVVNLVDSDWRWTDADLRHIEDVTGADFAWSSPDSVDDGIIVGQVSDLEYAMGLLQNDPLVETVEPQALYAIPEGDEFLGTGGTFPFDVSPVDTLAKPGKHEKCFDLITGVSICIPWWNPGGDDSASFAFPGDAPNDPLYAKQWHMKAMGAPAGWKDSPRGKGIVVAVIDTGVAKVEDLGGTKLLAGKSFVPGTKDATDDNGHGTHCAGTIAQTTNNGVGLTGVAPEASILPIKVLSGGGSGQSDWIASGIDWATDNGADVISMSLGGGYSAVIDDAVKKARAKGVIVVAATGNSGREGVSYPGALKEAIGVSATGPTGAMAPYSSWGKGTDIAAPGGDKTQPGGGVWQDTIDGKGGHVYAEYQGTSMATPHVAGAAAILLSTGMEPSAVEQALYSSGKGSAWDPKFGWGKLDLATALQYTGGGGGRTWFTGPRVLAGFTAISTGLVTREAPSRFMTVAVLTALFVVVGFLPLAYVPSFVWLLVPYIGPVLAIGAQILAAPLIHWPDVFNPFSEWIRFGGFPLWLSAILPALVSFTLGASKRTRSIATGLVAGFGANLLYGAMSGTLNPWFLGESYGALWLSGNAVACLLLALALVGTDKLEREHGSVEEG